MSRIRLSLALLAFALTMSLGAGSAVAGTIKGTVNGPDGTPVGGVKVRLLSKVAPGPQGPTAAEGEPAEKLAKADKPGKPAKGERAGKRRGQPPVAETTTDASGAFTFANVADGDYVIQAAQKGVGGGRAKASVSGNADASVTIQLKQRKPKA